MYVNYTNRFGCERIVKMILSPICIKIMRVSASGRFMVSHNTHLCGSKHKLTMKKEEQLQTRTRVICNATFSRVFFFNSKILTEIKLSGGVYEMAYIGQLGRNTNIKLTLMDSAQSTSDVGVGSTIN